MLVPLPPLRWAMDGNTASRDGERAAAIRIGGDDECCALSDVGETMML